MNLNHDPTKSELRQLLEQCDDDETSHVLWVGIDGKVHLDPLPKGVIPARFAEQRQGDMMFRLESFTRGNNYVGPHAASDEDWVTRLHAGILMLWEERAIGYQDWF